MKLSNKLNRILLLASFFAIYLPQKALAQCTSTGGTVGSGIECAGNTLPKNLTGNGGIVTTVINVMIGIIGIVAVIMIIVGAFRIVLSAGNEKAVADGKNTILFAVIGLVIAIVAFAIVNFVINAF